MREPACDVAVIGGGIVGCATALALVQRTRARVVVLEAEGDLAAHQSGHNSGVVHSGLYYRPGSQKAEHCARGRQLLLAFAAEHGLAHERCGKLVVASAERELPALAELERRGAANGIQGIRRLGPEEAREREPHVRCLSALHVPSTAIIDFPGVTRKLAELVSRAGGEVRLRARVTGLAREPEGLVLETPAGRVRARQLVNCAGLQSDRVARLCGLEPGLRIVPFRGEYHALDAEAARLVRNLIYPVPDARFPFLGVHFTRMIGGGVEAGPNAVLAFKREGYHRFDLRLRDLFSWALYGGFWRLAFRHWRMGLGELWRSLSRGAFVRSLQAMIPELERAHVHRAGSGVRAQALEPSGALVDDFRFVQAARQIHVLNAPSPAATASIAIGQTIAGLAERSFSLAAR